MSTSTLSTLAVCAMLATFFAWNIANIWREVTNRRDREREIEATRKDLDDAIQNGLVGRAALLRKRLRELVSER